ncbi:MAG: hypothetical protein NC226_09260 [Bacteroides cellulosilyticus]|nr:hypothetical protein [Bacteroides cellulosilyticus]
MMNWITGIVALLGGIGGLGGICSIFLFYRENKRAKQLDNEHKANEEWQGLVEQYKEHVKDLEETVKAKDNKIDSLYNANNELRKRNDKLSSTVAALTILRCKVVGCTSRIPPMGSRENARADEEQTITDKQE